MFGGGAGIDGLGIVNPIGPLNLIGNIGDSTRTPFRSHVRKRARKS